MWCSCDCNFFIKLVSVIVLIFAFIINGIGNLIGVGDIIETRPCPCLTTTVAEESTTLEFTTELTTQVETSSETATQAQTTVKPTEKPTVTVAPTTEATTVAPTTEKPTVVVPTTAEPATTEPTTAEPTTVIPTTTEPEITVPVPSVTVYDEVASVLVIPPSVDGAESTGYEIEPAAEYVDMGGGMTGYVNLVPGTTYAIKGYAVINGVKRYSKGVSFTVKSIEEITPEKPVIISVTTNSIEVKTVEGFEYMLKSDNGIVLADWQSSGVFSGLNPNTSYTVETRFAANGLHGSANITESITVKTKSEVPVPSVTVYDEVASVLVIPPSVDGAESTGYEIEPAAEYVDMGGGMTGYINLIPGTTYTIKGYAIVNGVKEYSKGVSFTVKSIEEITPEKPVIISVTTNSIEVKTVEGFEYMLKSDNGIVLADWQSSGLFANLNPDTSYVIETRYAANGIHGSANITESVTAKTLALPTTTSEATTSEPTTTEKPTTATTNTTKPETTTKKTTVSTTKPITTEGGPFISNASEMALNIFGGTSERIGTVIRGMDSFDDGSYVVCGTTAATDGDFAGIDSASSGYKTPYSFVAKFSRAGTVEWVKLFGDTKASVYLYDIAVLSNGNIVTVGHYEYPSTYTETGGCDAFILTLSASGNQLTKAEHSGTGNDYFYCISATATGYAVGGKTTSTDGAFDGIPTMSSVLFNFDFDGAVLWKRYLSGSKGSSVSGIDVDTDGNIFIACVTTTTDGEFAVFKELIGGYADTVIIKYDYAGNYQWYYALASSGADEFDSVAADNKGGCVVAGNYSLTSNINADGTLSGIHNCGDTDALVIRISNEGTRLWYKIVSGFYDDFITDIVRTDGGYAVTGYTTSSNREFSSIGNKGGSDGFIYFLDKNGTGVGVLSQGGSDDDAATCLAYSAKNKELLIAGRTASTDGAFADKNIYGSNIGYVGRYKITVG